MLPLPAGREASAGVAASLYERHRPERTLLYQLVEDYYPALKALVAAQGSALPGYVECEFDEYLKCGRLEHGLHAVHPCTAPLRGNLRLCKSALLPICLRVRCDTCHAERLVWRSAASDEASFVAIDNFRLLPCFQYNQSSLTPLIKPAMFTLLSCVGPSRSTPAGQIRRARGPGGWARLSHSSSRLRSAN
jgi:hypothetical protein